MSIELRPAGPADGPLLLAWRNDPVTRAAAFSTGEVAPGEHEAWLRRKLADPRATLWMILLDGEPAGQLRLDAAADGTAEVSLAVAPHARGRGIARAALALAAAQAPAGVRELVARIKEDNIASVRAFTAAGFAETGAAGGVVELRRLVSPSHGGVEQRPRQA